MKIFKYLGRIISNDQSDPLPFNVYIADLPETNSKKYGYADDVALRSSSERVGLITYVNNLFHYEVRQSINEYELWEGQIIQVKGGCLRKEIIVGNISIDLPEH